LSTGDSFQLLQRVALTAGEAAALFLLRDREPVFVELDARAHEHAFEIRRLAHEFEVIVGLAESHHALDAGAVVPGPVIKDDLARRRQVFHVALEIPLPAFQVGGLVERHDPRLAGVQMLHEPLDRAALARRIAAFEEHHEFLVGLRRPFLDLEQLGLKLGLLALVAAAAQLRLVRVFPVSKACRISDWLGAPRRRIAGVGSAAPCGSAVSEGGALAARSVSMLRSFTGGHPFGVKYSRTRPV
jgi:hypothetical protein